MSESTPRIRLSVVSIWPCIVDCDGDTKPVSIWPCIVVCGGGGGANIVEISPAKADNVSVRVSTKAAQSL